MTNLHRLGKSIVIAQAALWAMLLIIYFVVLPLRGFTRLSDFNDHARVASALFAMYLIVASDLLFDLTMLLTAFVLYRYMKSRMPLLLSVPAGLVLFAVAAGF